MGVEDGMHGLAQPPELRVRHCAHRLRGSAMAPHGRITVGAIVNIPIKILASVRDGGIDERSRILAIRTYEGWPRHVGTLGALSIYLTRVDDTWFQPFSRRWPRHVLHLATRPALSAFATIQVLKPRDALSTHF